MWVSREAAFRSADDWKDTIMLTEATACAAVIGLDVGKFIVAQILGQPFLIPSETPAVWRASA